MAVARAAAQAAEQTEREFQTDLNHAVAETEAEIFDEATGSEPLENDADSSLEAMGDGLEGEVLDEADTEDDADADAALEAAEDEDEDAGEPDDGGEQDVRFTEVPPGVHRQEKERRRAVETENSTLREQLAAMGGRFDALAAQLTALTRGQPQQQTHEQQQQQQPDKPDMFAEPERYEQWLLNRATSDALTRVWEARQAEHAQHVNQSLEQAARGERAFEFTAAYNALGSLDPRNPQHQAQVRAIYGAPDTAQALFDWWDQNGGPQFREQILTQLMPQRQRGYGQRPGQAQGQQQDRVQPRHEFRPGQSLPSLNGAAGSNSQRVTNPEFLDNTDASVFDFATRR
jgi:hypothetical protein